MTQGHSQRKGSNTPVKKGKGAGKKSKPKGSQNSSAPKKTSVKKTGTSPQPLVRTVTGLLFLIVFVVGTGWLVHQLFPPEDMAAKPPYEIYPTEEKIHRVQEGKTVLPFPEMPDRLPEVAIIIDDIGYSRKMARKLGDLDIPITFSVLPQSPYNREIAAEAHGKGIQIMLHLPMEPMEFPKVNPGPGALLVSMDVDDMIDTLYDDLADVPYVVGVNNHMGSRMTTISTRMYQIFSVLKKRELFFIDSRTSAQSLCRPSARLLQITFGERDVFLDHNLKKETIRKQVRALIHAAERNGQAIGIGHPHTVTYEVLREELPALQKKVRLVHASDIVKPLG